LKILAGSCCALLAVFSVLGGTLDSWQGGNKSKQLNSLYDVVYANGLFLTCGAGGEILTSADGINWTEPNTGTSSSLRGAAFGFGYYVVVGYGPTKRTIRTSVDAKKWKNAKKTSSNHGYLLATTYAPGLFVTVGNGGAIQTSTSGLKWYGQKSRNTNDLYGVAYGDGRFVAVGTNGTIVTSANGTNWINGVSGTTNFLRAITYDNGIFVVVGHDGTILHSVNGITWNSANSGTTNQLFGVGHGEGNFVAVGGVGTIVSSTDAINWVPRNSNVTNNLFGVAYANGTFVAVGISGLILYSNPSVGPTNSAVQPVSGTVQPSLTADGYSSEGFRLTLTGEVGRTYRLQYSHDALSWTDLLRYTNTQSSFQILDTSATNDSIRLYRVLTP
jgi:hypothetical protein